MYAHSEVGAPPLSAAFHPMGTPTCLAMRNQPPPNQ
jgi:hypothetical protein